MSRFPCFLAVLFIGVVSLWPAPQLPRVAIGDFAVTSDNPKLKYIGKGLAEMIATDLYASKGLVLIDRDRRDAILGEMEFALSAAADPSEQMQAGKLLAADYLLFGAIVDMDTVVLVSCRMISVETGAVVWTDERLGPLSDYDKMSRTLAASALKGLKQVRPSVAVLPPSAAAPAATPAAPATPAQREEAIVAFSKAIDSYDKRDMADAKKQLKRAKAIDPTNAAVQAYLDKLTFVTAKFKAMSEQYLPSENPAYLGIIDTDQITLSSVFVNMNEAETRFQSNGIPIGLVEQDVRQFLGYRFPLGKNWGVGVEGFAYHYKNQITGYAPLGTKSALTNPNAYGGILTVGNEVVPGLSLGVGMTVYDQARQLASEVGGNGAASNDPTHNYLCMAPSLGLVLRNRDSSIVFDSFGGWSTEKTVRISTVTFQALDTVDAPLFIENTLSFAFAQRRIFAVLKQDNNVGIDHALYAGTIAPSLEAWLFEWLAIRASVEGDFTLMGSATSLGLGGTGGLTLRIRPWNLDIDLNMTYRQRPSRTVEGQTLNELVPFVIIRKTNSFITRQ